MLNKKALYRPAPEHPLPASSSLLPQGETAMKRNVPKIKQGILETSQRGNKPLTSTLKTTKPSTKPLVVCHNPTVVHSYIKECDSSRELAKDTVATPKVVVIPSATEMDRSSDTSSQRKQNITNSSSRKFVKSRYKQAATSAASKNKSANNSSISREKTRKDASVNYSGLRTPIVKNHDGKTSTPSSGKHRKLDLDWNASAIERSSSVSTSFSPAKPSLSSDAMNVEEDNDDLEILYCQYMQWRHLNLSVKKETELKTKQATKELIFLQDKNAELSEELEDLEKEVMQLEHQYEMQKQLEIQKTGLGPVVDKLPGISGAFASLAENLDTTRHNIPLVDAFVPKQDDLESTLDETRNLLGQISIMIHSQAPVINQMSLNATDLSKGCGENKKAIITTKAEIEKEIFSTMKKASLASQLELVQS